MLADALRVMERRAADELEIPLYDGALVASMLRAATGVRSAYPCELSSSSADQIAMNTAAMSSMPRIVTRTTRRSVRSGLRE